MPQRSQGGHAAVKLMLIVAGGAMVLAGGYYWRRNVQNAAGKPAAPPIASKAEMRDMDATVIATGTIRLRTGAEVRVGAQISGIVNELNVTVGSHIANGDVIAVIDSRGLTARIAQAQAQIEVDRAALGKAALQWERAQKLRGLVPRQQEEDAEQDVVNAKAKVVKSQSDLAVVESDIPYLTIRAPISGTIASVSTQQGETVAASFNAPTFVTIIEDNALELVAMVDETDIANVRPANAVVFSTETYPAREFRGVVERVSPKAAIVSGVVNYEVGIRIQNDARLLKPDMTVNATIRTAHRRTLMLPTEAIHAEGERKFVLVAGKSGQERRDIVAGSRTGPWTEIRKGLREGDEALVGRSGGAGR